MSWADISPSASHSKEDKSEGDIARKRAPQLNGRTAGIRHYNSNQTFNDLEVSTGEYDRPLILAEFSLLGARRQKLWREHDLPTIQRKTHKTMNNSEVIPFVESLVQVVMHRTAKNQPLKSSEQWVNPSIGSHCVTRTGTGERQQSDCPHH